MNDILKILQKDKRQLTKKFKELGLDKIYMKADISTKEWAAIHCAGVLTGYKFYLNRIKSLLK